MIIKADQNTFFAFDLDDTLYYEFDYLASAYRSIASDIDPLRSMALFNKMIEIYRSGGNTFSYLVEKYSDKNLSIDKLLFVYRNHIPEMKLKDGVNEMFEKIKMKKSRIGIITNGRSITQRNKLSALGILSLMDEILISEETGFEKPDEANYLILMHKYPGFKFLYFGDNPEMDFTAPKRLSWHCIGIRDKRNIHLSDNSKYNNDCLPDNFISSFREVEIE